MYNKTGALTPVRACSKPCSFSYEAPIVTVWPNDGKPMNLGDIESLIAVVRKGSINAAAEELFTTQPALSRRIASLETELGCRLIERSRGVRTVKLTPEGERFLRLAPRWVDLLDEVNSVGRGSEARRRDFRVGCIDSVATFMLQDAFKQLVAAHPEVCFNVSVQHSRNSYLRMEEGSLSTAIIADVRYARGILAVPLFAEKMVLVTSADSDFPHEVDPRSLDPSREIRVPWHPTLADWYAYWMPEARPRVVADKMSLMMGFLDEPNTWAIAHASMAPALAQRGLKLHELTNPPADITCYALVRESESEDELTIEFIDLMREAARGRQGITVL